MKLTHRFSYIEVKDNAEDKAEKTVEVLVDGDLAIHEMLEVFIDYLLTTGYTLPEGYELKMVKKSDNPEQIVEQTTQEKQTEVYNGQ
jgi:hypothetical protein